MPDPARSRGLVLDTSVWINLLATEALERIPAALGTSYYAPDHVVSEIKRHPVTNAIFSNENHPLHLLPQIVTIATLDAKELNLFLDIVSAPITDALGDGEAAAIAIAVSRGLDLGVDDRKARRIIRQRFGQIQIYWTTEILGAGAVRKALGVSLADECWEKAKRFGRMHVPR